MSPAATRSRGVLATAVGRVIELVVLLAFVAVAAWLFARPKSPDAFYDHPRPHNAKAGALLKSEPFTNALPAGAQGWRLLYVTARGGKPALASAIVVTSKQPSDTPRPIVAWAHGTTGVAAGCAPSMLDHPFENLPDMGALVRAGWAYVGTDYTGLGTSGGHTYLVGEDAATAVLDAVRAARQLKGAVLDGRFVVWGHSQGGNAALWTGFHAGDYAPELRLMGIAALAPASDLKGLVAASKGSMFGKIVSSYLVQGYAQAYPDVKPEDYVRGASRVIAADIASRCVGGYATLMSVLETKLLPANGIFATDPTTGPLGTRLGENTPNRIIPAPVLIAQGEADDLVAPAIQERYVDARCRAGQAIDFRSYAGRDHVSVVTEDSPLAPELHTWTRDRFEAKPAPGNCKP